MNATQAQNRLRAAREAHGISIRQMAVRTGFDRAYISRVERGLQKPSLKFLLAAGRVLGLKDFVSSIERFYQP